MANNIITATFDGCQTTTWTSELYQWDYGQVLRFEGLDLPEAYEVHFSNNPTSGTSETRIGNADGVVIPNTFLTTGGTVYAWVYLHDAVTDGETEYMVTIPVRKRPQPSSEEPTPEQETVITEAIIALNNAVEQTGADVQAATAAAVAAEASAEAAAASETNASEFATAAASSEENAAQSAEAAANSASAAAESARIASEAAQSVAGGTERAERAARDAEAAKATAQSAATQATQSAVSASTSATQAAGSATSAAGYAGNANTSAQAAAQSAGTATAKAAEAAQSAQTASTAATNAGEAQTASENAKTAAQNAQAAVETAAASIQASAAQIATNTADITDLKEDLNELTDRVDAIEDAEGLARYGVSGIGQSASALTRLYDAVGMVAQVGTDGDNSAVRNDFDNAAPWKWRKCVGHWTDGGDRAIFHVHAYLGDDDYTEDGTNGDFVAVECPISYYKRDGNTLVISAHRYDGYRPFDIFCHDHNPQDTIPYYYRPAYSLTLKDGKAVSLPGYDNEQGSYKQLMDAARTYDGGELGNLPFLYPMALSFYDWAMYTVEFATQHCQSIMQGCAGLRHNNDDRLTFRDATHVLISNWYAARVVGEYIAILPTNIDINHSGYKATHKILTVTRCTADGTASASGTYTLLELEDLGKNYFTYDLTGATEYRIAGRPYRTGACNEVSTPSGSPVSNTDSFHPMRYRYVENLFGNQYKTVADFFNKRVGTGDDDYYLEHYYLPKPHEYVPSSTSKPDATDLATDAFVKLGIDTEHENYINGYVRSKKYDEEYPDLWIPHETTGASASTYFADYAYLVHSSVVRSVRLYGNWTNGAYDGLSLFNGFYAPSVAFASYGGDLCFPQ